MSASDVCVQSISIWHSSSVSIIRRICDKYMYGSLAMVRDVHTTRKCRISLHKITCDVACLNVKCQILTCFCDVISLLVQVFIVSLDATMHVLGTLWARFVGHFEKYFYLFLQSSHFVRGICLAEVEHEINQ